MFSKRPDKYTTGLVNMRNDCFANSSLQAYLSLPGLTEYINTFNTSFFALKRFMLENSIGLDKFGDKEAKDSRSLSFSIPLHLAFADLVLKLQETRFSHRTISVWSFLHTVERIFNARISKSQHDAQELIQLINETLEKENTKVLSTFQGLKEEVSGDNKKLDSLNSLNIPEFPCNGLVISTMQCLVCNNVSKPSMAPFTIFTLHTPQSLSAELKTMLKGEPEAIEGYHCLKCRTERILSHEKYLEEHNLSTTEDNEKVLLDRLKAIVSEKNICINDDLSDDIEDYINSYKKTGLDITTVTSTVLRESKILKPPKVFLIHLSRSTFDGTDIARNSCHVAFKDHLSLSIGKEYLEKLKLFKLNALEEERKYLSMVSRRPSRILTNDINDVEDEDNQKEDYDERSSEDESEGDITDTNEEADATENDDFSEETDTESTATTESKEELKDGTYRELRDSASEGSKSSTIDFHKNVPISESQTNNLKRHFKRFAFNENDIYRYRLKAVIQHYGSHTQGHYECYRKKPLYVKDKDGQFFKLSPEISQDALGETVYNVDDISEEDRQFLRRDEESKNSKEQNSEPTRKRGISLSLGRKSSNATPGISQSRNHIKGENNGQYSLQNVREKEQESGGLGFRLKLSSMMGRNPSIYVANHPDFKEVASSRSAQETPAEVLVNNEVDYFSYAKDGGEKSQAKPNSDNQKTNTNEIKMRKISSLIKNPFWRINDSNTSEASLQTVLNENRSVYMLFYERQKTS